ncbi:MAG: D-alanyl-D-alanine carboxypeptidase family protein [Acidobacteria bacterium]|nr:D-alanyl-D-alanine carboxypeptidase family protein [Acidobacteriota bacterium]MBS1811040.1 D-alanyl-D-alanine carboxypeptidase family protein [Acidobacteriota bacterium]
MKQKRVGKIWLGSWLLVLMIGSVSADKVNDSGDARWAEINTRNEQLKSNLDWFFGGKSQRGWSLYLPLISTLIETDQPLGSKEFAAALTRWQQLRGLPATGLLNQETWMKMVEQWQGCRSKDRTIPTAEKLHTVSGTEFYDPERPLELRQVERETYAAYKRMVSAASRDLNLSLDANGMLPASETYLKIISAFRSPEYQQKLRQQSPNSGRAGLAVNSPHFTGRALDLYVGGEPVSTKDANRAVQVNTKVYRWLVKNAGKFGFIPYFYEPWHWEYNPQAAKHR